MNNELLFLNILLNKDSYNLYIGDIDLKYIKEVYREISYLYETLIALHTTCQGDLLLGDLITAFQVKYPEADKVVYGRLFQVLQDTPMTPEVGLATLKSIKASKAALKLSELGFRVSQGTASVEEFKNLYEHTFNEDDHPHELPLTAITTDLGELLEHAYSEQGYRWRLECLNRSLGSLRAGDFGFIFARPETGKTTFLASEVSHFLCQGVQPVLWFNNEEQGSKVMMRVYQAFFGVTMDALMSNPKRYKEEFQARTGNKFRLFDSATISKHNVEQIVKTLKPGLVIYDQLTKIKGFKADRNDLLLGEIFQWARELAKGSHAAIGVSQADGSAEGVRYLTMDNVANVKTAVQAEADWILGIGKTHAEDTEYVRYLNICKNKLLGDKDSLPELRHGKFETIIEPSIARYVDIISYK